MMKKTRIFIGAFGVLAGGLVSCSSDVPDNSYGPLEKDEVRYLKVAICSPSATGTRADEDAGTTNSKFENGTIDENQVNNLCMDFYDAAGKFVKRVTKKNMTFGTLDKPGDFTGENTTGDNSQWYRTAIVQVDLIESQNIPAYVICYLNPVVAKSEDADLSNATMDDLRNFTVSGYSTKSDNKTWFAMTNSCYFGNDPIKGQANVKISGTPIPPGYLYNTREEAAAAKIGGIGEDKDKEKYLEIYVERLAAKVRFTANTQANPNDFPANKDEATGIYPVKYTNEIISGEDKVTKNVTLQFVPEAWTINAEAQTMYAIKKFAAEAGGVVPTYGEVNAYLAPWGKWNDEPNKRSYWSCSPSFFETNFPQVSDNIYDDGEEGKKKYKMNYYSYNEIVTGSGAGAGNKTFAAGTDETKPCKYTLENTVGKGALSSVNPKAAVPSILMVGKYELTYDTKKIAKETTFYIFDEQVYFDSKPKSIPGAGGTAEDVEVPLMKDEFIKAQTVLYTEVNVAAEGEEAKYEKVVLTLSNATDAIKTALVVKHPEKAVRDVQNVAMRSVTLQLTSAPTKTVGAEQRPALFIKTTDHQYTEVTAANLDAINTLLWNQVGVADCYNKGRAYFSIPIMHSAMNETDWDATNLNPIDSDGSLIWKNLKVGDLGVVRNHVYDLSVKAIKGLGTAIEDPDKPIVPPADVNGYWIKYKLNILNWRTVTPQGNIIL